MKNDKVGIQRRIALFILIVGMFPVILGFSLFYIQGRREITKSVGEDFSIVAREVATNIDIILEQSVWNIRMLSLSPVLRDAVKTANLSYANKDNETIEAEVRRKEAQWVQSGKRQQSEGHLTSPAAAYLAEVKKQRREYSEIVIADIKGVLVAAAAPTKYVYYGKERWWQVAYNEGKGDVYISEIYLDPDSNQHKQSIAVPLMNETGKDVLGVIHTIATIERISNVVNKFRIGETGHAMLINSETVILLCPIFPPQVHRMTGALMDVITGSSLGWAVVKDNAHEGINAVAGFAPVDFVNTMENALDGNKWYVFVSQSPEESYAPVYALVRRMVFLSIFSVVILAGMAYSTARRIVKPIHLLQRGAQTIGEGNLNYRIRDIRTGDEIEGLADEFNRMVEKLNESYTILEQRVAERTAELRKNYMEVETLSRLKTEFLANVSHELRTPLNSVLGFSELLCDKAFGDLNEKQLEFANYIHKSGAHLLELINDILDLSKIEAGKMEIKPAEFSVGNAIKEICSIIDPLAIKKKISVSVEVADNVSSIRADERMFKQIMYNLLSNSVKFTNEGGRVMIKAASNNYYLQISVTDSGIGMKKDDLAGIFKEFRQVDNPDVHESQGTGLGLTLVKRYVEMQGGTIWAESEYGKGSNFIFRIPVDITKI